MTPEQYLNVIKTTPLSHQLKEFEEHKETKSRAIFWEQGTGKTKLVIDTVAYLWKKRKIDAVFIIAPSGVGRNWLYDELPIHLHDEIANRSFVHLYQAKKALSKRHYRCLTDLLNYDGLSWLAINYEAVITQAAKQFLTKYLKTRKVFYILDESQYIKNPTAKRTKSIVKSSAFSEYRRILTGTPVSVGPFDVYPQIKFIDDNIWKNSGFSTFTEFKNYFGIFEKGYNGFHGKEFQKLVSYRRVDELNNILRPYSTRVTKEQVLDLPDKVYTKVYVPLSPKQERLYAQLKDECIIWLIENSNVPIVANLAIVKMLRLQQIICGYVPTEFGEESFHLIDEECPRLTELMEILEQQTNKVIVWARFIKDIDLIMALLKRKKIKAVRYDGQVSEEQRAVAKKSFQEDENCRVFVGNQSAGATGLTLTAAKTVIYYSNNFKLIDRLQSEDRAHRIGQSNKVLYIDLVAENSIDEHIIDALRTKFDIASQITGDKFKEWL